MSIKRAVETVFKLNDQFSGKLGKIGEKAAKFNKLFGTVLGANIATQGFMKLGQGIQSAFNMLPAFAERAGDIKTLAQITGMATDEIQRLQSVAKLTSTPVDILMLSFKKMSSNLAMLAKHQGPMQTNLRRINPQLMMQLRHVKDNKEAFLQVADAIAKTENPQKRAAMAMAIFGKQGQEILPMLMLGRAKLNKAMQDSIPLTEEQIEQGDRLRETLKRLHGATDLVKNTVLASLAEAVNPYVSKIAEWVSANKALIATKVMEFIKGAGMAIQTVWPFIRDFGPNILLGVASLKALSLAVSGVQLAIKIFAGLNTVIFAFQAVAGGAATVMEALNLVFMANPVGLIIAAVAAIAGLIYLIVTNWGTISAFFEKMFGAGGAKTALEQQNAQALENAYSFDGGMTAPNVAALAAGSWNGRLDIAGAPKGSTLAQTSRGAPNFTAGIAWGEN